jgi:hypothetical protein
MIAGTICRDLLALPVWLAGTGLVGLAAWTTARRLFPGDRCAKATIHTIIVAWGIINSSAILLGSLGLLNSQLLLFLTVFLSALLVHALPGPPCRADSHCASPLIQTGEELGYRRRPPFSYRASHRVLYFTFISAAVIIVIPAVFRFPTDVDTLLYHLPLIDQWLVHNSLFVPECAHWFSPGNMELLGLWTVGMFSGDYLLPLHKLPIVALLFFATVEFCSLIRMRPWGGMACAFILTFTRVSMRQLVNGDNDIAGCALFLAANFYGLRLIRRGRAADSGFFAVSVALLAGIKYYTAFYALVLCILVMYFYLPLRGWVQRRKLLSRLGCAMLVLAAYWYIRNIWFKGTPIYPAGILTASSEMSRLTRQSRNQKG